MIDPAPTWLTVRQAAARAKRSISRIHQLRLDQTLVAVPRQEARGLVWYIDAASLEAWIASDHKSGPKRSAAHRPTKEAPHE